MAVNANAQICPALSELYAMMGKEDDSADVAQMMASLPGPSFGL